MDFNQVDESSPTSATAAPEAPRGQSQPQSTTNGDGDGDESVTTVVQVCALCSQPCLDLDMDTDSGQQHQYAFHFHENAAVGKTVPLARVTTWEMLCILVGYDKPMTRSADEVICSKCIKPLRKAYNAVKQLHQLMTPQSLVGTYMGQKAKAGGGDKLQTRDKLRRNIGNDNPIATPSPVKTKKSTPDGISALPVRDQVTKWLSNVKQKSQFHWKLQNLIKTEMKDFSKETRLQDQPSIAELLPPDEEILAELEKHCPTVHLILVTLFLTGRSRPISEARSQLTPKLKLAIGLALTTYSQNCNRVQKAVAIQLWRIQCLTKEAALLLSDFNVSVSLESLKSTLGKMLDCKDQILIKWKKNTENFLSDPGASHCDCDCMDRTEPIPSEASEELPAQAVSEVEEPVDQPSPAKKSRLTNQPRKMAKKTTGRQLINYSVIEEGDSNRVSVLATKAGKRLGTTSVLVPAPTPSTSSLSGASLPLAPRRPRAHSHTISFSFLSLQNTTVSDSKDGSKVLPAGTKGTVRTNAVSMLAIMNRVPFQISDVLVTSLPLAVNLDPSAFLPTVADFECLRQDHVNQIKKILSETLPAAFGVMLIAIPSHEYSTESAQTTRAVNLGLMSEDDRAAKGISNVLKLLATHLPDMPANEMQANSKYPMVAFGDGVTADRAAMLQRDGANSGDIVMGPSGFHTYVRLLREDVKIFMNSMWPKEKKLGNSCTLYEIRQKYLAQGNIKQIGIRPSGHALMKQVRFALQSYVTALALQFMCEAHPDKRVHEIVEHVRALEEPEKEEMLNSLAKRIMEFEWHTNVERGPLETQPENICACARGVPPADVDNSSAWIRCADADCLRNRSLYHKNCLNETYVAYGLNSPFVGPQPASKKRNRARGRMSKAQEPILLEEWYCTPDCQPASQDSVLAYSKGLIFMGLNHECYRSAVHWNDGPRLLLHHKLQLVHLHNAGCPTQFRIWHRALAMIAGVAPPHIRHDLLWNTTVNLSGTSGGNMEVDLYNEFVNRLFKRYFAYEIGAKPPRDYLQRKSRLFDLDKMGQIELAVFNIQNPFPVPGTEEYAKWMTDVSACVLEVMNSGVLVPQTGNEANRSHKSYQDFSYKALAVHDLEEYKVVLKKHSENMDAGIIPESVDEPEGGGEAELGE